MIYHLVEIMLKHILVKKSYRCDSRYLITGRRALHKGEPCSRNIHTSHVETVRNGAAGIIITVSSRFHTRWYVIVGTERATRAITDSRFCLLGKVVVDIRVRYSEASLTLVAGTTVVPPKIVRAMTPRLYIPPVCARGGAAEGGGSCPPNSLVESHGANQLRRNESRARVFFPLLWTVKIIAYEIAKFTVCNL